MRHKVLVGGILLGAAIISVGIIVGALILKDDGDSSVLSSSTSSVAGISFGQVADFTPYYFANNQPPAGFKLDTQSIQYEQGVLFYILTDESGNKVTISQQKVPDEFVGSVPQGDEKIEASYGTGGISLQPDRTTANILSNDDVFILINADVSVDIDSVKTISRSLTN